METYKVTLTNGNAKSKCYVNISAAILEANDKDVDKAILSELFKTNRLIRMSNWRVLGHKKC